MEKLTDFELEQFKQQLINDGTDTQVRKLIDEVKEYRALAEQIGCPLEVRCQIYEGQEIYDEKGNKMGISEVFRYTFEVYNIKFSWDRKELSYSDHKKTWWLKADLSE